MANLPPTLHYTPLPYPSLASLLIPHSQRKQPAMSSHLSHRPRASRKAQANANALRQPEPRVTIFIRGMKVAPGYVMQRAEPDVGIFHCFPEVYELRVWSKRDGWQIAPWFERSLTPAEWDQVNERICEEHSAQAYDYARYGEG